MYTAKTQHLHIACMSPLWQAGYSLVLIAFIISPWLELNLELHFVTFSAHICVNRIHLLHRPCAKPQFILVRTRFSYADLTPPVFQLQDPVLKLTNQGQAKLKELGDQHHPDIQGWDFAHCTSLIRSFCSNQMSD